MLVFNVSQTSKQTKCLKLYKKPKYTHMIALSISGYIRQVLSC